MLSHVPANRDKLEKAALVNQVAGVMRWRIEEVGGKGLGGHRVSPHVFSHLMDREILLLDTGESFYKIVHTLHAVPPVRQSIGFSIGHGLARLQRIFKVWQ